MDLKKMRYQICSILLIPDGGSILIILTMLRVINRGVGQQQAV